ncbi:MAG: extracellular solute-binding protein [Treponema sp.]|nr:extracellular solute-binding protein [Treponema sp.]
MGFRSRSGKFVFLFLASFLAVSVAGAQVTVSKPVKLSIIDAAGNLQLSKPVIEAFKAANPNLVASIEYLKLTSPEVVAKIRAQEMAGSLENTMLIVGLDAIGSSIEDGVWEQIMPKYQSFFPNLEKNYLPGAKKAYDLMKGYGIVSVFCPGGPLLTYNPDKVTKPITTPAELLAWAKANPGKFFYARPANSGPGRSFLQGLPYILGDKDPKDPRTWDKTWAYLKELDQYIDYYPTGTAVTFKELAEGTRWMIASHIGWDMNQRILQIIPSTDKAFTFTGQHWINDAHYLVMPAGLDKDRRNVTLALMAWMLKPENQAATYATGYFYPGPAIKDVPLSMASKEIQDQIRPAMRENLDEAVKTLPNEVQLDYKAMATAFDMWDQLVGSKIKK